MITTQVTNVSEVATLRIAIALECEALQRALNAPATVSRHAIIAHHYQHVDRCTGQLAEIIGEREANTAVNTIYHRSMEE